MDQKYLKGVIKTQTKESWPSCWEMQSQDRPGQPKFNYKLNEQVTGQSRS